MTEMPPGVVAQPPRRHLLGRASERRALELCRSASASTVVISGPWSCPAKTSVSSGQRLSVVNTALRLSTEVHRYTHVLI